MPALTDKFSEQHVWWRGRNFASKEDARWAAVWTHLRFRWEYQPRRELHSKPEPGIYKPKVWTVAYQPAFWVEQLKHFVDIRSGWPRPETLEQAMVLAERSGHPVAIFKGPLYVPTPERIPQAVPVTVVHGEGDVRKRDRFLVDDGWRIHIGIARSIEEITTERLMEAFSAGITQV